MSSLELIEAFVNTAELEEHRDDLREPAGLVRWLAEHGLAPAQVRASDRDAAEARAVREALRELLRANNGIEADRDSASASEIVTGALQDHHRAKVVGTRTFGKGVFQEVLELDNGGALDITAGQYFTPDGHNLGGGGVKPGAGIQPDVQAVDNPKTKPDEALNRALQTLAGEAQ